MTRQYHRARPEGQRQRLMLRWLLRPRLVVGAAMPTGGQLARFLRISESEARRHLHRMLDEAGIATETRGKGRAQRVYIVAISNNHGVSIRGEAA